MDNQDNSKKIKENAYRNLQDLKMIFDKAGIFFWIEHGLLLGLYRGGDIMDGDAYDIDICIWQKDVHRFEQIMSEFNRKTLLKRRGRFKERSLRYLPDGTLSSVAYRRRGTQLDIKVAVPKGNVVYHLMKEKNNLYCVYVLPDKFYKDFGIIKWWELELNCPKDIEGYLVARYGKNWRTPIDRKSWNSYNSEQNPCIQFWEKRNFKYMEQEELQPIDIILCTYNRLNFLKQSVKKIYKRTCYPHRLWVVDNNSTDGTQRWLKIAKAQGYIYEHVFNKENQGLASGLTIGFKYIEDSKGGISEYVVTCHDDNIPPSLTPCWLERLLHLFKKYEPEYGAIALRCNRIRRRDVDEHREIIDSPTSLATFFRMQRSDDIQKLGYYFTNRPRWESPEIAKSMKKLKKKLATATHLYVDDIGFAPVNKGFAEGFTGYKTYVPERVNQGELQPFPDIDPKTCIPLKINTSRDRDEQGKRDAYYDYWGRDDRKTHSKSIEQVELAEYTKEGKGLDCGCGKAKIHEDCIGVDIYPYESVNILHDCRDLWMFKDNELDFIVSSHTLEHMPNFIEVLKEWARVLKIGGILAVAVPDGVKKPRYIINNGHKVNIGLETLRIVFKHKLKMKIIRVEHVKKKKENQHVALIVGIKR